MPDVHRRTLISPGPAQFCGPCAGVTTQSLCVPQSERASQMTASESLIAELKEKACAGCAPEVLQAVRMILHAGVGLLKQL